MRDDGARRAQDGAVAAAADDQVAAFDVLLRRGVVPRRRHPELGHARREPLPQTPRRRARAAADFGWYVMPIFFMAASTLACGRAVSRRHDRTLTDR